MIWNLYGSKPKWWHPEAPEFEWRYWLAGEYWRDLAQKVIAWKGSAGVEVPEGVIRLSAAQANEFVDHPAVEYAMYSGIRDALRSRWADRNLREHVAADVWVALALDLIRGVRYYHLNEHGLRRWLTIRAYWTARGALRPTRRKEQTVSSDVLDSFFSDLPEVIEILDRRERVEAVMAEILRLPARQRKVVLGRLAGEKLSSIAKRLKVSTTLVCNDFQTASETLRVLLASRYAQPV